MDGGPAQQRSEKCGGQDAAKGNFGKAYIGPEWIKQYLWEICCPTFSKIYPFEYRVPKNSKER